MLLLYCITSFVSESSITFLMLHVCIIVVTVIYILNQQFITWSTRANCGSYFVTIYIQTETT